MQRATVGFFSLLLCGALGLAAQTAIHPPQSFGVAGMEGLASPPPSVAPPNAYPVCPVRMQARQGTGRGLLMARNAPPPDRPSQRIHLVLADDRAAHAVRARITVQGLSDKARVQNALSVAPSAEADKPEMARTLMVRLRPEDKGAVSADLLLPGFTSVQSIRLESLTYDNGSKWNAPNSALCSVVPDPMMLIAGR